MICRSVCCTHWTAVRCGSGGDSDCDASGQCMMVGRWRWMKRRAFGLASFRNFLCFLCVQLLLVFILNYVACRTFLFCLDNTIIVSVSYVLSFVTGSLGICDLSFMHSRGVFSWRFHNGLNLLKDFFKTLMTTCLKACGWR